MLLRTHNEQIQDLLVVWALTTFFTTMYDYATLYYTTDRYRGFIFHVFCCVSVGRSLNLLSRWSDGLADRVDA